MRVLFYQSYQRMAAESQPDGDHWAELFGTARGSAIRSTMHPDDRLF